MKTFDVIIGSLPAYNKGFAIAGVPCFADTLVHGGSSVLRIKFSAKIPAVRDIAFDFYDKTKVLEE